MSFIERTRVGDDGAGGIRGIEGREPSDFEGEEFNVGCEDDEGEAASSLGMGGIGVGVGVVLVESACVIDDDDVVISAGVDGEKLIVSDFRPPNRKVNQNMS